MVALLAAALANASQAQTAITTNTTLSDSTTLGSTTITNGAVLTLSGGDSTAAGVVVGALGEPQAGLVITDGALLTNDGALGVGTAAGNSPGTLTISGPGTRVTTTSLGVGHHTGADGPSMGSVTISDGAALVTSGARSRIGGLSQILRVVGFMQPLVGTMTVTGAGSSWLSTGSDTQIGAHGAGRLRVLDGGSVTFEQQATIGVSNSGFVEVRGAGSTLNGDLLLGNSAPSVITVADGGVVVGKINFRFQNRSFINIGGAANESAANPGVLNLSQAVSGTLGSTLQLNTTSTEAAPYYLTTTGTAAGAALSFVGKTNVLNTNGYNVFTAPVSHAGDTIINGGTLQFAQGGSIVGITSSATSIGSDEVVSSTGGVFLNAGTLDLGGSTLSVSTESGAAFTLAGGTVRNGVLSATSHALHAGTVDATLSGFGAITKSTSGTVYLNATPTAGGGTNIMDGTLVLGASALSGEVTLAGGVLDLSGGTRTLGAVTLTGGEIRNGSFSASSLEVSSGAIGASVTGSSGLIKTGSGAVTLSGNNTFTGGATITGGRLELGATNALPTAQRLSLAADGTLVLNDHSLTVSSLVGEGGAIELGSATLTVQSSVFDLFAGVISGTGGLTKAGSGVLLLGGAHAYTGATNVTGGMLGLISGGRLDSAGSITVQEGAVLDLSAFDGDLGSLPTISGAGTVNYTASHAFLGAGDASGSFAGPLNLGSTLTKEGQGTYTITAPLLYFGATAINGGTLRAGGTGVLSNASLHTVAAGATLDLDGYSNAIGALAGTGAVTLGGGTLTVGARGDSTTFSGGISGAGGLTKDGVGTLTLAGTNSYSGSTTINAGTLTLGAASALPAGTAVNVAPGATLALAGFSRTIGSLSGGGAVTLGNATLTIDTAGGAAPFAGEISGSGALEKIGAGTFTLHGSNGATGGMTIAGGTVVLGSSGDPGATTVMAGGALDLDGHTRALGNLTLAGGTIQNGALALGSSAQLTSGTVSASLVGSSSLTKTGGGTLTLSGANTYSGSTTIDGGTLAVATGGAIAHAFANIGVGNSTTAELTITGGNVTAFGVNLGLGGGAGTLSMTGGTLTTVEVARHSLASGASFDGGTLRAANNTNLLLNGFASGSAVLGSGGLRIDTNGYQVGTPAELTGVGGLTKTGAGTLSLTGASEYAGTTTIEQGTLQLGNGDTTGTLASTTLVNHGMLAFNRSDNVTLSIGVIGTGGLNKLGSGTLTVATEQFNTGATLVSAGTLTLGEGNALRNASAVFVGPTGTFDVSGVSVAAVNGLGGAGNITLGDANLAVGASGADSTFAGVIGGTGALIKVGTGTLTLSGANTYSGATTIDGGTLAVATGGAIANASATIGVGDSTPASLALSGGSVAANAVRLGFNGGAGTLSMTGGTLTTNTLERWSYESAATFAGGTLRAAADAPLLINGFTLGSATLSGGGLTIDTNGHSAGFSANTVLDGSGGLTKIGGGTLTLGAPHAYTGATTINAGTLAISADESIGDESSVSVAAGATFALSDYSETINGLAGAGAVSLGTGVLTVGLANASSNFAGVISGTGGLVKTGTGTLTLSGANTYAGTTTIDGGALTVATGGVLDHAANGIWVGNTTSAEFTMTGGEVSASSLNLGREGGLGIATLNGGTLTTSEIARWSIPSAISFNGGTLRAAGDTSTLLIGFSSGSAVIHGGGLTIDTNGHAVSTPAELTGTGGLTKTGAGTLTLSGATAYSGATNVSAGTLALGATASLAHTSAFRVASGATLDVSAVTGGFTLGSGQELSGAGTVVGAITITDGATLAPGNSPGTLSTGAQTWAGGGSYVWEINDANGQAGVAYDIISITGSLTFTATPLNPFTVSLQSLGGDNQPGLLANFDPALNYTFRIASFSAGVVGFDPAAIRISTVGFANATSGVWSVASTGSDLDLTYLATPIPEPATFACVLGLAALGLSATRRRRYVA